MATVIPSRLPATASQGEQRQLEEFVKRLGETVPAVWLSGSRSLRNRAADSGLKIQTIHSAKGLQYRAVIIMFADRMPRVREPREEYLAERRLLYVAMARAMSFLAMTASSRSQFVAEMTAVPSVETIPVVAARREEARPLGG